VAETNTGPADFRQRVHAAARDELKRWGIDRFNLVAMAGRHQLDADEIRRHWADDADLIVDVLLEGSGRTNIVPDTGSLRGDLLILVTDMAEYVTSGDNHVIQGSHIIVDHFNDGIDIRRRLWQQRALRLGAVFDRAQQRGEMRADIDHATVLELLLAPVNMRALFTGEPIDEQYCRHVADLVWHAIRTG